MKRAKNKKMIIKNYRFFRKEPEAVSITESQGNNKRERTIDRR